MRTALLALLLHAALAFHPPRTPSLRMAAPPPADGMPPPPSAEEPAAPAALGAAGRRRLLTSLPCGDALDRRIALVALPSAANFAVAPLVGAVDTFWVGQMGDALALAGQGAANTCFFACFFLVAFIPTVTAPLVASAAGEGDMERARQRICEALYLANVIGAAGTLLLVARPEWVLRLVLSSSAPAMPYAVNYLRFRSISLVPALFSSVSFAAFRGTLDTVTPLKVSLASNVLNLLLDPILIFGAGLGVAGAALATALAELLSGGVYLALLLRRKLASFALMLRPPRAASLLPLLQGALAILMRQAALNVAFVSATRTAQLMDPSGVAAAAYSITNQMYSLGLVVMLAIQSTGATIVPAAIAKDGVGGGRAVADRLLTWSLITSVVFAVMQVALLEPLTNLFTTIPAVREAVRKPAIISALVQSFNGPLFAGEGILMGVGGFGFLSAATASGVAVMVGCLKLSSWYGGGITGIWLSLGAFHVLQFGAVVFHHLRISPLARVKTVNQLEP
ncbi:hypothetical protein AB1Y20_019448 [Prymnesium parvum]|uniref:Protein DETOXIFICATION n=1 Tax=Prymnesium parvum TaxID=97485 RepID=A0AB34JU64_PRYPA